MSRELKFRAWDKKRKRYAKVIQTTNQSWKGYRDKTYVTNGVMLFSKWVLSRFIIEQYTGLKDKNGKEICEGDIVKYLSANYEVYFDKVQGWRGIRKSPHSVTISETVYNMTINQVSRPEVIGNIHEPPKDFRPEHLKRMGVSISKGGNR